MKSSFSISGRPARQGAQVCRPSVLSSTIPAPGAQAVRCYASNIPPPYVFPPPKKISSTKLVLKADQHEAAFQTAMGAWQLHFSQQCLYTLILLGVPDIIGSQTLSVKEVGGWVMPAILW